jgi:hypothetical protein
MPPRCSRIPVSQLCWGGGMRERKGVQRTTEKRGGVRRIPRTKRAGRVVAQPREARLQPCPIACDTPLYRAVDTRLYGFRPSDAGGAACFAASYRTLPTTAVVAAASRTQAAIGMSSLPAANAFICGPKTFAISSSKASLRCVATSCRAWTISSATGISGWPTSSSMTWA